MTTATVGDLTPPVRRRIILSGAIGNVMEW